MLHIFESHEEVEQERVRRTKSGKTHAISAKRGGLTNAPGLSNSERSPPSLSQNASTATAKPWALGDAKMKVSAPQKNNSLQLESVQKQKLAVNQSARSEQINALREKVRQPRKRDVSAKAESDSSVLSDPEKSTGFVHALEDASKALQDALAFSPAQNLLSPDQNDAQPTVDSSVHGTPSVRARDHPAKVSEGLSPAMNRFASLGRRQRLSESPSVSSEAELSAIAHKAQPIPSPSTSPASVGQDTLRAMLQTSWSELHSPDETARVGSERSTSHSIRERALTLKNTRDGIQERSRSSPPKFGTGANRVLAPSAEERDALFDRMDPKRSGKLPLWAHPGRLSTHTVFQCKSFLYEICVCKRAGRLTAKNGGFRPG
jgi:hypothetical protein